MTRRDLVGIGRNGESRATLRHQRLVKYRHMQYRAKVWGDKVKQDFYGRIIEKLKALYGVQYV